jgi:hypothetical protein
MIDFNLSYKFKYVFVISNSPIILYYGPTQIVLK